MKHTEEMEQIQQMTSTSRVKYQTIPFTWKYKAIPRAYKHQLYRETRKLQINPDTRTQYPNECRGTDGKICHPETEKRVLKKHQSMLERNIVPTVIRPKRMNKLG